MNNQHEKPELLWTTARNVETSLVEAIEQSLKDAEIPPEVVEQTMVDFKRAPENPIPLTEWGKERLRALHKRAANATIDQQ